MKYESNNRTETLNNSIINYKRQMSINEEKIWALK